MFLVQIATKRFPFFLTSQGLKELTDLLSNQKDDSLEKQQARAIAEKKRLEEQLAAAQRQGNFAFAFAWGCAIC